MTYRKFDTGTWQDPWFENLSPRAKLAFIYFWTNETCNQSGAYQITEKRINFELGYHIDTIYLEISDKIYWNKDTNLVFVKNFFKRQCQNRTFAIAALNAIKDNPEALQVFMEYNKCKLDDLKIDLSVYHTDTIPIPISRVTEQNRTEKKQNRTEQKKKPGSFDPPSEEILKEASIKKINSEINTVVEKLYEEKIFPKVHAFKNKMLKINQNERAILHTLSRCYLKRKFDKESPWGYCMKIMQVENGNYNESDYNKTA